MAEAGGTARWPAFAAAAAAVLVLHLALVLPNHPAAMTPAVLRTLPLELPAILALLAAAPRRLRGAARGLVTLFLVAMALVKLADFAANLVLMRPFDPALDLDLLPAGWRVLIGAVGPPLGLAALAAFLAAVVLLGAAVWWATGRIARIALPPRAAWLAAPALLLAGLDAARLPAVDPPGTASTARLAFEHIRDGRQARIDLALFRDEAARDPLAALPPERILGALRGSDVLVVFVESYGRAAVENPRYAPEITAALAGIEAGLDARGLAARSAYLTAPMTGGQSWLAHASVLSGLWIDGQGRYRALLASPRRTLLHLARAGGWQTAAVVPAITLPWPEADYFGYDRVLAAADLGYAGLPFNWVTMPDQFTLRAFEREMLGPGPRDPVFAEIALISSHAPWTPVPPLLAWEAVGDGRIYDAFATAGDPPEVVWRDPDRVRDQYRLALGYALRTVGAFAERRAATGPLIVVLGDHQPAPFVSGDAEGRDVPIHLIGRPETLARVAAWGWTAGMVPGGAAPAWRMDAFRDRFVAAFADPPWP